MNPQELQRRLRQLGIESLKLEKNRSTTYGIQHLIKQLVRSATSAGLNYAEACSSESKLDFIHKMRLVHKELNETKENLAMLMAIELNAKTLDTLSSLHQETDELNAIASKSIQTAVANLKQDGNRKSNPLKNDDKSAI